MSDQFTSVEEKGLGTNLVDSIKGVAVGGLLFICSFIVLWMNEGRVDLSEVAKKSVVANPASVDSGLNGKFISVTGDLKTDEKIGDPELLNPGNYLRLHRNVEMFAWIETVKTSTEKKTGGKKVETRTVTYSKGWTDKPKLPNEMEQPKGHENIPLTIKDE
ncbi:MAG TPA: TMEM43 family protein, partial [Pseudomonadota bacterium]|nr:TMEM43 family protein [Pseudomonadota bacterium]